MNKTTIFLSALIMLGAIACSIPDTQAGERIRGRVVASGAEGGRVAATGAAARGEQGAYARGRVVASDGQGNASGRSGGYVQGANGGEAARQGSFQRNADGSASRQGSAYANGANGGTASTSGGLTRDADGNVNGARSTNATSASGNSYNGSTTVEDGQVTRTATCTNAAGEIIDCRGD